MEFLGEANAAVAHLSLTKGEFREPGTLIFSPLSPSQMPRDTNIGLELGHKWKRLRVQWGVAGGGRRMCPLLLSTPPKESSMSCSSRVV